MLKCCAGQGSYLSVRNMSEADIKAKVGASHLTPAQKQIVMHRVHENIEKGCRNSQATHRAQHND